MTDARRAPRRLVLALVCSFALLFGVVAIAATSSAAEYGTIKGTVTKTTGGAAGGIVVEAYAYDSLRDQWVRRVRRTTAGDGKYELSLPPGTYRVRFGARYDGAKRVWFGVDSPRRVWQATDVKVTSGGNATADGQVTMLPGITGKVGQENADWWAFGQFRITATNSATKRSYETWAWAGYGQDANYSFSGLPVGSYTVAFGRFSGQSNLAAEYYNNVPEASGASAATAVPVAATGPTALNDAKLAQGGTLKALLQYSDGTSYDRYCTVSAYTDDATLIERIGYTQGYVFDGSNVQVGGLATGSYQLRIQDCGEDGATYYYDGDSTLSATPQPTKRFNATVGAETALGTLKLPFNSTEQPAGASISGKITFPAGEATRVDRKVRLVALGENGKERVYSRRRAATDGTYSFAGLEAGTYRVDFARFSGQALSAPQFYNGKAEGAGKGSSTPIAVGTSPVTNINATLVKGGRFTGTLRDADGTPLRSCRVLAMTPDRSLATRSAVSGADGSFDLTGLSTGNYRFLVAPGPSWWEESPTPPTPTPTPMPSETPTGPPMPSETPTTEPPSSTWRASDCANGVQFLTVDGKLTHDATTATTKAATTGGAVALGALTYLKGATISGTVTLPEGVSRNDLGRFDTSVRLYGPQGVLLRKTTFDDEGSYEFVGVRPRAYTIGFARGGSTYRWTKVLAGQFYKNVPETSVRSAATQVQVIEGQHKVLDPVTLQRGGAIAGIIRDTDGAVVRGCTVEVFGANLPKMRASDWISRYGTVDEAETFRVDGLAAGSYSLRVSDCVASPQYVQANGIALGLTAPATDPIVVTSGATSQRQLTLAEGGRIKVGVDLPEAGPRGLAQLIDAAGDVVATRTYASDRPIIFRHLLDGSYRVEFDRVSGNTVYRAGYQRNSPDGSPGAPIVISGGNIVDLGTQAVVRGGVVEGHVVDKDGDPYPHCYVRASNEAADLATRSAWAGPYGGFRVPGLSQADYYLMVDCDGDRRYYDGDSTLTTDQSAAVKVAGPAATKDLGELRFTDDAPAPALSNKLPPTIGGTPQAGSVLTATNGTWTVDGDVVESADLTFGYQWYAGGVALTGADQAQLTLSAGEVGKKVTVKVTARTKTTPAATASATSAATEPVAEADAGTPVITNASPPVISGTPKVGVALSVTAGTWKLDDVATTDLGFAYQWYADRAKIDGATSPTFTPTAAQVGKKVSVVVTATKTGAVTATQESAQTGVVAAADNPGGGGGGGTPGGGSSGQCQAAQANAAAATTALSSATAKVKSAKAKLKKAKKAKKPAKVVKKAKAKVAKAKKAVKPANDALGAANGEVATHCR